MMFSVDTIMQWLEEVKDPEIPVLSLPDLGVITSVSVDNNGVVIEMTPTFVGCPAIDMMKSEIVGVLRKHGVKEVAVNVSFREQWTSERMSVRGKEALKHFGLAPPPQLSLVTEIDFLEHAICPRCSSSNTELKNTFGPTLCRSIHYCIDCKETFEQFKPI